MISTRGSIAPLLSDFYNKYNHWVQYRASEKDKAGIYGRIKRMCNYLLNSYFDTADHCDLAKCSL